MDNAIVHRKIVGENNDLESSKEDCSYEVLAGGASGINRLQVSDFCRQRLILQRVSVLQKSIPKQIMTVEEKYLRHCLELIHTSAMRENSCSISSKIRFFPEGFGSGVVGNDDLLLVSSGDGNRVLRSSVNPIVGSITGSRSMINLINSPLLRQLDAPERNNTNYQNPSVTETSEASCVGSSQDIRKKDQNFGCDPVHKRIVSSSSTNSTSSSSSSSSSSSTSAYSHGMLHCLWNNGFPRYVFSVEDQREVYTTNLVKTDSGFLYTFYSRSGKWENEANSDESDLVGKLRVSTSFSVCPLGTEIMETQFILSAADHHNDAGMHTSNPTVKKSTGLSKKVAGILRGNHSHWRRRTSSKFDGSVQPESLLEANEERDLLPANLEVAAIVVKDHIPSQKVEEVGGWGLKFLKGGPKPKIGPVVAQSVACEACKHNNNHHSVSMDVIVPAGFHGGPRTRNGGPSGLIERWRSGGRCDCGGWDTGCPLTVLNSGQSNKDLLYKDGVFGKSNSFELFTQGCKQQGVPVIEVTNVNDGLYYIHYQSRLSGLQSLSIAVAIIHSHSPTLKPKLYRN